MIELEGRKKLKDRKGKHKMKWKSMRTDRKVLCLDSSEVTLRGEDIRKNPGPPAGY